MRNKLTLVVLVALVAGAGTWFAWRALRHPRDTVTLQVRNLPLADVAAKIFSQTGKRLNIDPKLEAKISFDVKDMPLSQVLDILADQAAARWSRTFAVYDTKDSLNRLEGFLHGESSMADAGWTNLAPRFAKIDFTPPDMNDPNARRIVIPANGSSEGNGPLTDADIKKLMEGMSVSTNGKVVFKTDDVTTDSPGALPGGGGVVIRRGPPGAGGPGGPGRRVMKRVVMGPDGIANTTTTTMDGSGNVSVMKIGSDGKVLEEDQWSRDRLVINQPLCSLLSDAIPDKATTDTADATAKKVHSKYTVYYSLEKPPTGWISPGSQNFPQIGKGNGTNNAAGALNAAMRDNLAGGLGRLTPEQQVQRARQMQDQKSGSK